MAVVFAIATASCILRYVNRPQNPPPGYTVACDGQGHYCWAHIIDGEVQPIPGIMESDSYQAVVDHEWNSYEFNKRHPYQAFVPKYDYRLSGSQCCNTN